MYDQKKADAEYREMRKSKYPDQAFHTTIKGQDYSGILTVKGSGYPTRWGVIINEEHVGSIILGPNCHWRFSPTEEGENLFGDLNHWDCEALGSGLGSIIQSEFTSPFWV